MFLEIWDGLSKLEFIFNAIALCVYLIQILIYFLIFKLIGKFTLRVSYNLC